MKRSYVKEVLKKRGRVLVKGWVHDTRDLGKIKFLLLRDVSGIIQVTATKDKIKEEVFKAMNLPRESVVSVEGKVVRSKQAPEGVEIIPDKIKVISEAMLKPPIPIIEKGKIRTDLSKRLNYRWIDLRKPKNLLIFKIWTCMDDAMREFWLKNGFDERKGS